MSMNVVPVSAPRVSKATLSRPAARSASFKARTVSNGAVTKAMQVRPALPRPVSSRNSRGSDK